MDIDPPPVVVVTSPRRPPGKRATAELAHACLSEYQTARASARPDPFQYAPLGWEEAAQRGRP